MPVSAAAETHIAGNKMLEIVREVSGVSNPVSGIFNYTLTADENNPAEIGNIFGHTLELSNVMPDENGVARFENKISFSRLTFTQVGDYIIHIKETYSSDAANYPIDEVSEYQILVSVRNQVSDTAPTGELVATLVEQVIDKDGDKTDKLVFGSEANRTSIALTKMLSGNAANTDEYFKFKLDFNNAHSGDVYTILGQDDVISYGGETIVPQTRFTVGEDNYVYLKGGQTVEIGKNAGADTELPIGLSYTFTEIGADDYRTYVDDSKVEGKESLVKTTVAASSSEEEIAAHNTTLFENVKNSAVMTGVSSMLLPFIGLAVIGIISTCTYLALSRKK